MAAAESVGLARVLVGQLAIGGDGHTTHRVLLLRQGLLIPGWGVVRHPDKRCLELAQAAFTAKVIGLVQQLVTKRTSGSDLHAAYGVLQLSVVNRTSAAVSMGISHCRISCNVYWK
jgi:hypothetical protein